MMRSLTTKQVAAGRRLLTGLLVGFLLQPAAARAWWNEDWKGRKQFTVDATGLEVGSSESMGPAAVLVRLHAGNFKLEMLKEDGSDLRIIAADDKTPLKYHLEKFDAF